VSKPVSAHFRSGAAAPLANGVTQEQPVLSPRQIFLRPATWFAAFENTTGKVLAGPG